MATAKEFFGKNKKAIYIGGAFVVLGGASYLLFGYKGKDGKTVFGRWTKKKDEEKIEEAVKSDMDTLKDLLSKGVKPEGMTKVTRGK